MLTLFYAGILQSQHFLQYTNPVYLFASSAADITIINRCLFENNFNSSDKNQGWKGK